MYKIVVLDDRSSQRYEEERKVLAPLNIELVIHNFTEECDESVAAVMDADAVLVHLCPVKARSIGAMTKCKIIARYGVGTDNIDIEAASAKGVWVTTVPSAAAEEVAVHCLAMLLACARTLLRGDKAVRAGKWNTAGTYEIHRLSGRKLGLIGFGATARQLSARAHSFSFGEILAYDPHIDATVMRRMGVKKVNTVEEIYAVADYISLHLPATSETRSMINKTSLALMKKGVIIINTARGSLIKEADLIDALKSGQVASAGLDVFEQEPINSDNPLLEMNNVVLSDHSSYYSIEAEQEMKRQAAGNILRVLTGQAPDHPVNKPGLSCPL